MADDESFGGSTEDLIAEIKKMEKEKEELEKKNRERQQLEQHLKQLKGNVTSLKSGKNSAPQLILQRPSDNISSDSVLNASLQESQARLRTLQENVLRSPQASTSFREEEDSNKSFEDVEDDVMTAQHKHALRENRDVLVENMTPDDIFNDLISKHILSNSDVSRIKEKNTIEAVNEELLNVLVRRSDRAFTVFVSSLRRTLQSWLANRLDPDVSNRGKRKRRTGELNVDVECERVLPQSKKRYACTCREVEEQILIMSKGALSHLRRRDGTAASFEQFNKESRQTNELIKDSLQILHSLKMLCRHGEVSDLSEGSVRFTVRCSSFASCRRLWEDYKSGAILQGFEKGVITPSLLKICGAKKIFLRVRISKLDYLTCALELGQEQQNLNTCQPPRRNIVIYSRQKRDKPRRLCNQRMKENSPICAVEGKGSTILRVFREISPNILTSKGSSKIPTCIRPNGEVSSFSSSLCSQTHLDNNIDHNSYAQENITNNVSSAHGTFLGRIDLSHILPCSTGDVHYISLNKPQRSPVYKTRSKTLAGHTNRVHLKTSDELLSRRQLKYSLSSGYNLRCRSIRT